MVYKCPLCNPFSLLFLITGLTLMFFKGYNPTLVYLGLTLIAIAYAYPIVYSFLNAKRNRKI